MRLLFILAAALCCILSPLHAQWFTNSGMMQGTTGKPTTHPSVLSISPSSGSFTCCVQNGSVTTLTVVMSDGSSFFGDGGTLSITGTNSGGFQVSGSPLVSSLKQSASVGGTVAGTYTDFNIVATLPGSPTKTVPQNWSTVTGVACDQGPRFTGSLPADVTTSGLTYCALNADYTVSGADGNGINYQDITTWIAECGAPARTYNWHIQYWFNDTSRSATLCGSGASGSGGRAALVNDPLGGNFKVIDAAYLLSDQTLYMNGSCAQSFGCSDIGLTWPDIGQGTTGLPYEMYIETSYYMPTATLNSRNPAFNGLGGGVSLIAINSTSIVGVLPKNAHLAVDQFEIIENYTNSGATTWGWTSGWAAYQPNDTAVATFNDSIHQFDFRAYHAYGQLITSDESNHVSVCSYIDGVRDHCNPGGASGASIQSSAPQCSGGGWACYFGQNSVIFRAYLALATCGTTGATNGCYSNDLHTYIKSIRIFTCSGYKTAGHCGGPIISADNGPMRRYANDTPEGLIRQAASWLLGKAA
jgi:hypothetical protein